MITLQGPILPPSGAQPAHGDANGARAATGTETTALADFAARMAEMLPLATNPAAAALASRPEANGAHADASASAQQDLRTLRAQAAHGAAAAIESAIAIAFPAPIGDRGAAPEAAEPPPASAAPERADAAARLARGPEFGLVPRPAASAAAAAAEPEAPALPLDAPGRSRAPEPPAPQASDAAQAARAPEFQGPQPVSRAAEIPAAAPRIDAPLGSVRWREDLAGHITVLVRNATPQAEIRVTPPELGPIHARISVDNGIATVALSASLPETREALEAALTTLRERLAGSGLALGEASVSGERESRFGAGAASDSHGGERAPSGAPLPEGPSRRLRLDGLLDLYA